MYGKLAADNIDIEFRIIGDVKLIKETILTPTNNGKEDKDSVLRSFKDWLRNKNFGPADHNVLLTGYDFASQQHANMSSMSWLGGICSSSSVSVVTSVFNGGVSITLAHVLASSLGVKDDGKDNACAKDSGHVMNPVLKVASENIFYFSSCSRAQLKNVIASPASHCLTAIDHTGIPKVRSKPLGQLFDHDAVCRMSFGTQSYVYRGHSSTICLAIYCHITGNNKYALSVTGTDGFQCGSSKICSLGKCVASSSVSSDYSDTCPFGDLPSYVSIFKSETCQTLKPYEKALNCKQEAFRTSCCGSCRQLKKANAHIPGCEYGDHASWCSNLNSHLCTFNARHCCNFCYNI